MHHNLILLLENQKVTKYTHFAHLYDVFMQDAPYDDWVSFTEEVCAAHSIEPTSIIDLGCGTGEVALRLADKGYDVTGIDLSADMLTVADQKAKEQTISVTWLQQDLRTMEGFSEIDLAISYCDVINYITEQEELKNVLKNVYESLRADGLFIFDVHAMEYVERDLIDHTFSDVDDDMAYIWNCFGSEKKGELFHELTFFAKQGDHYERFDEDHHQRTYETTTYVSLLKETGFANIKFYSDFQLKNEKHEQKSERIFIVAQKQSR